MRWGPSGDIEDLLVIRIASQTFRQESQRIRRGHDIIFNNDQSLMQTEHFCQAIDDRGRAAHVFRPFHHFHSGKALGFFGQLAHSACARLIFFMAGAVAKDS